MEDEDESGEMLFAAAQPAEAPERASESVMSGIPSTPPAAEVVRERVSSGAFEIPRDSFLPPPISQEAGAPPSAIVSNALGRGKEQMPLGQIVAIAGGIVFVLILLSLLLFR